MIASMTLAEIQAKYADVHTPEEVAQFHPYGAQLIGIFIIRHPDLER